MRFLKQNHARIATHPMTARTAVTAMPAMAPVDSEREPEEEEEEETEGLVVGSRLFVTLVA